MMPCHSWRNWVRPLLIIFYILILIIVVPFLVIEFQAHEVEKYWQAWFIGGLFVLLTIPISMWGIIQHLIHYTEPFLQRHIIRILWMVPIYSIDAWLALRFKEVAIYLDTLRECYEAYVIYNFMAYLLAFLNAEYPNLNEHLAEKPVQKHLIPLCWCPPWKMGESMVSKCRHGVLQYTVIRPMVTIVALICQLCGAYKDGEFSVSSAWLYLTFINNASQVYAMYCLVLFYHATKEELQPLKPISKFLCVKAVVFMSFWQSVLIAGLVELNVIRCDPSWQGCTADDVGKGLQDFCICIEMFIAAIAHYFSFSHRPYVDYALGYGNCWHSFQSMWDVSDVRDDVVEHVRQVGHSTRQAVQRPFRQPIRATDSERQPILGESAAGDNTATDAPRGLRDNIDHLLRDTTTDDDDDAEPKPKPLIDVQEYLERLEPEGMEDDSVEILRPSSVDS